MAINRIIVGPSAHYPAGKAPRSQDVHWQVDWTVGGKRKRKRFTTKDQAKAFETETLRSIRMGQYVDPKVSEKVTVAELYSEWIERIRTVGATGRKAATPKTVDNYRRVYKNYIGPAWGHTALANVTYDGTSEWIATLRGMDGTPAGPRTRQLVATVFGRLMGHGVKRRIIASNPTKDALGRADYVPSSKRTKKHTYLTMPQLLAVAKAAGEYELMILLAGMCGLRWGEITALTTAHVQLGSKPMLHVAKAYSEVSGQLILGDTKGGEARHVPIPSLIALRLESAIDGLLPEERVFSSARGAVLRNSKFAQTVYKPAITEAAAGDEDFPSPTFHDLRHTAVSLAISSGSNVKVVQRIAGHASATLTLDTYAGLFDDDLHDSADRLNDRLKALGWQ